MPDKYVQDVAHETDVPTRRRQACTCPVCGNDYFADPVRLKHGRQSTCSRACSYKMRTSLRTAPFFARPQK